MSSLATSAIESAINGDWETAIKINKQILKENPTDLDSLNRLAKGLFETGKVDLALKTYKKVLEIDPINQIASKCMAKIHDNNKNLNSPINHDSLKFLIEDPSKTTTTSLTNIGSSSALSTLYTGCEVKIRFNTHKVSVTNLNGVYIGKIPDLSAVKIKQQFKNSKNYKAILKANENGILKVSIIDLS